jgi:hypothetical protein
MANSEAASVEEPSDSRSSLARLDHFLRSVRTNFQSLQSPQASPNLPVTRDDIYLDHD